MKTTASLPDLCFDNAWVRELPADAEKAVFQRQVERALHSMVADAGCRATPCSVFDGSR